MYKKLMKVGIHGEMGVGEESGEGQDGDKIAQ